MPVRKANPQALPARTASVQTCHLGRGTGLIDEHQPFRIEIKLPVKPSLARSAIAAPVTLAGTEFSGGDRLYFEEAPECANAGRDAALLP